MGLEAGCGVVGCRLVRWGGCSWILGIGCRCLVWYLPWCLLWIVQFPFLLEEVVDCFVMWCMLVVMVGLPRVVLVVELCPVGLFVVAGLVAVVMAVVAPVVVAPVALVVVPAVALFVAVGLVAVVVVAA